MKHRLVIPWLDEEPEDFGTTLTDFIGNAGWQLHGSLRTAPTYNSPPGFLSFRLVAWYGSGLESDMIVRSGMTLIYDDTEGSLGLTTLREPRDATPAQQAMRDVQRGLIAEHEARAQLAEPEDETPLLVPKRRVRLFGRGVPTDTLEPEDEGS